MSVQRLGLLAARLPCPAQAAIILTPANRYYFTGVYSSDGVLVVTKNAAVLLVDSRYIETARKTAACEVELITDLPGHLNDFCREYNLTEIALETTATIRQGHFYKENLPGELLLLPGLDDAIQQLRNVKDSGELEQIRTAQCITEAAFDYALTQIKPGITERELALLIEIFMRRQGAAGVSFDLICVSGSNTSLPHGQPSDKPLQKGELITLDIGCVYNRYCSDMTRTVALGAISGRQREVYELVKSANIRALSALKSGIACVEADAVARDMIRDAGYGQNFGHGLGHGVGLEVHERPTLSPKAAGLLHKGHVVTVEPGIYLAGEFGVRIEDMAVITRDGCENLTGVTKELIVL